MGKGKREYSFLITYKELLTTNSGMATTPTYKNMGQ